MEPVEMAAADTTSDSSPLPDRHQRPDGPAPKKPRLYSDIPSKQKPVGIAQPFRQLPSITDHSDSEESQSSVRFSRLTNENQAEALNVKVAKNEQRSQEKIEGPSEKQLTSSQSLGVPWGRKWIVFLSHSSADQPKVKRDMLELIKANKIPVAASYHFQLEGEKSVHANMAMSCILVLALSPSYLASERCNREWEYAVQLKQSSHYELVVTLVAHPVSRPPPLKKYLYLDFVDPGKHDMVWDKLNETIDNCMTSPLPEKERKEVTHCQTSAAVPPTQSHPHTLTAGLPIQSHPHTLTDDHPQSHSDCDPQASHVTQDSTHTDHPHHTLTGSTHPDHSHHAPTDSTHPDHPYHPITDPAHTDHHPHSVSTDFTYLSQEEDIQDHMIEDFEQLYQESLAVAGDPAGHVTHTTPVDSTNDAHSECSADSHVTNDHDHMTREAGESGPSEKASHMTEGSSHVTSEIVPKDVEEGEVDDSSDETSPKLDDQAAKVTSFYNQLAQPEADKRQESPIVYMRNFNNWVKSVLIRRYLGPRGASVLDLCCGKGGDLLKWKEGWIAHLVCADISDVSVEAAEGRYHSKKMVRKGGGLPFSAEFICADCCQERLRDRYQNPGRRFHLTSCQFSIHYSFESYERAHMMLRNACENLLPGGFFIGTTVDANQLVYRLREAGQNEEGLWTFGNDIFRVTLSSTLNPHEPLPLFRAKYNFKLHGVVDLPEYLIHFPTFQHMLGEFDMEFILKQNFIDFFHERRHIPEDANLLYKMSAFDRVTGTMSAGEWEAIGLYMVYVFRKRSSG